MKTCILLFSATLALSGCSNSEDDMPGYTGRSGDLGAFIVSAAGKLGARPRSTNGLPEIKASWYSKDDDLRTQVFLSGNYFPQLQQFLTNAFGPLPEHPQTNNAAGKQSIAASYGTNVGAEINYSWERTPDGKEYTSLMISKVLKPAKSP